MPEVDAIWEKVVARDGNQKEFLQAVKEVLETMVPIFKKNPMYISVFERMVEPERAFQFRVPYLADNGEIKVNRGFRVQYSSAIGPYKGGLRFHPSVNLSIIKFLGFEQVFKNSLTTLPMGGGKGGSDFDPKGKSDAEVMRFCQSFMTELSRHIGPNTDVPAGDIGVGGREVGFMYGQYKRIQNAFEGVLTGKGRSFGGSLIRPEATGYGCVYFVQEALKGQRGEEMKGKKAIVSGSGNVALFTTEKLIELGSIPLTMSDSGGYIYEKDGFTTEKLAYMTQLKTVERKRISEYVKKYPEAKYVAGERPWGCADAELAFPSATQNEINEEDAKKLAAKGCVIVGEGANMPSTPEAIEIFHKNKITFCAAKAANAGGVAVSGLEMSQNSIRLSWTREEVDEKLHNIMKEIYKQCAEAAKEYNTHIQAGANIAGFLKVAEAMIAQGCV